MNKITLCVVVALVFFIPLGSGWNAGAEQDYFEDYIIQPSDILEISVYGEQELIRELVVRPDGKVSFPLIGDVQAAGRTTRQVKEALDEKLAAYLSQANSTVIVMKLGSLTYFVLGQVAKPGVFNVSTPLTVLQALSLAGGLSTFAAEKSILIVRGYGDKAQKIPFDYAQVKRGRDLEQNILLERGDVVLVP